MQEKIDMTQPDSNKCLKFIHTADLHLGSPFSGIARMDKDIAELLSHAGYGAYERIIETAIDNAVDFILIAGDIYESQNQRIIEQLKFHKGLERLDAAGISVYIICGNHDPARGWSKEIVWPKSVHFLRSDRPELIWYEKNGVPKAMIIGMSYPRETVAENLARRYPDREDDWPFTIGLLHCTIGTNTGHDPYSPCSLQDLAGKGYDYWALGHIHKPSVLQKDSPAIVYAGIPQGRDIGESGPRGCYLVTTHSDADIRTEFIETASVVWQEAPVSIDDISSLDELRREIETRIEEIRSENTACAVICRITLTGRGDVHRDLVQEGALQELSEFFREQEAGMDNAVYVERFIDATAFPVDREMIMQRGDLIADVLAISEQMQKTGEIDEELTEELGGLFEKYHGKGVLKEIDEEELSALICEAETYLLDHLIPGDRS
ncbi:metallophosphoesterase family protein [Methanogenium organophilum]|uniref:DNA repair exonuclease n=1 Tax=Methanogenium organophilum TaxID=2199 RepID=A0A9X9S2W1_METOG|nr:DNA repair exonuclease [Methanogenium organophilum]WAI00531.1 DNA repair exonuclease [Methanogenium organophilum]